MNNKEDQQDRYKELASLIFEVPIEEVSKEQRSYAKTISYCYIYGIHSPFISKKNEVKHEQTT